MTKSLGEGGSTPWLGCSCILAHKGEKSTSYPWISTPQLPTGYAEVAGSTYSGMARIWTWLWAKKQTNKGMKDRQQFLSSTFISPSGQRLHLLHVCSINPHRLCCVTLTGVSNILSTTHLYQQGSETPVCVMQSRLTPPHSLLLVWI